MPIEFPLDPISTLNLKRILRSLLPKENLKADWDSVIRYETLFESSDNFSVSGTVTLRPLTITTGAVSGNSASIASDVVQNAAQPLFTFEKAQRFRVVVQPTSDTSQTIYLVIGDSTDTYFGFKIVNGTISGVTQDLSGEQTVTLKTFLANDIIDLEAEYKPKPSPVVFFKVNGVQRGVLVNALPVSVTSHDRFFDLKITTNTAAAREMIIAWFSFIQEK